ncbi:hypothetical protein HOP50_15g75780 [Chloropicon primus]|uniref:SAP domain-containing protein n=1 Tax=Chloropicon primus TaxID=1764295 RepID=A0A5B8MZB8_9CHLO|nr:hypothetical protein A3770_15p75530 [Chloropicon primus]UPR04243.1 hypothetical protein HOP50_15g75780 [Chloropicon primus]|eukprot:QDZ25035.1 hypothetical protein A3770_15p75530 [Chloropicon primus]
MRLRATGMDRETGKKDVQATMDEQLEAQLERLRIAERENAELKRMIDELEAELDIDFEMLESSEELNGLGLGPSLPELEGAEEAPVVSGVAEAPEKDVDTVEEALGEDLEAGEPSWAPHGEEVVDEMVAPPPATTTTTTETEIKEEEEEEEEAVSQAEAESETYTEEEIMSWKVKELKVALKKAGKPVSGVKKVLQQRALENLL